MELSLTEQDKRILIETARAAIGARLAFQVPRYPEPTDALRGCIGHIAASRPLFETVREVAVSSAFEDPRFPPLEKQEWSGIRIEISVLSPFEKITDMGLIRVGTHGIMIRRGYRSGLLLPQVATEQGWDRDTFLTHACFKAGLPADAWKSPDANIEIFSAIVFGEEQ